MAKRREPEHEGRESIGKEFVENYGGPLTAKERRSEKTSRFINEGKL